MGWTPARPDEDQGATWRPVPAPLPGSGVAGDDRPAPSAARSAGSDRGRGAPAAPGARATGVDHDDADADAEPTATAGAGGAPRPPAPLARAVHALGARSAAGWRRASGTTRVVAAATALGVASLLVVGAGVALQPRYPVPAVGDGVRAVGPAVGAGPGGATEAGASGTDDAAAPTDLVDDLRTAPTVSWESDVGAALAAGAARGCTQLQAVGEVDGDAVVAASLGSYGFQTSCQASAGGGLARVDLDTGDVAWTLAGRNLGLRTSSWWSVVPTDALPDAPDGARPAVVTASGPVPRARAAVVDLSDGTVLGELRPPEVDGQLVSVEQTSGDLVLVSSQPEGRYSGGGSWNTEPGDLTRWEVHRVADVVAGADHDFDRPVWRDDLPVFTTITVFDGHVVVQGEETVQVLAVGDGTGGDEVVRTVAEWPVAEGSPMSTQLVGGALVVVRTLTDGTSEVLRVDDGGIRWVRPFDSVTSVSPLDPAGACLQVSERGGTVRCVALDTGEDAWTTTLPLEAAAPAWLHRPPGSGDTFAALDGSVTGPQDSRTSQRVLALTGDGGRVRYELQLPADASVGRVARTTGYAFGGWARSGRVTSMSAFDLADGRPLWEHEGRGVLDFWGSALVEVDEVGVARRLVAPGAAGAPSPGAPSPGAP